MIETIYSRDNSEEMSKPEVNIRLPKNIKQIGQGSGNMNSQIYIEENVIHAATACSCVLLAVLFIASAMVSPPGLFNDFI